MKPYTKEWLEELCASSYSYSEVLRKAGRKPGGGSNETLKKKILEYGIDVSHFTGQRWQAAPSYTPRVGTREKYTIEEVFTKIITHMREGICFHDELVRAYDFLGLWGYSKC